MGLLGLETAVMGCFCIAVIWISKLLDTSNRKAYRLPTPPFVPLTQDELINTPVEAMTKALREHGPIVEVERNGHRELLVSKEYTRTVLTDEKSFSFEEGMAKFMHLDWIFKLHGGTFFQDMDAVVKGFLARRMDHITTNVWPIFENGAKDLANLATPENPVDILHYVQHTMGEATINIFFGEDYQSPENTRRLANVAEDIAEMMGLFQNHSFMARRLPWLWRPLTWCKIVLFCIPYHTGYEFARKLWADMSPREKYSSKKDETVISFLVNRYKDDDGHIPVGTKVWIIALSLTMIFASLHQTAVINVWITYFLALRPESQEAIRKELIELISKHQTSPSSFKMDFKIMQEAVITDSFIREVLRMKRDSVNLVRGARRDVELAGYTIPKGSILMPVTYQSYRSKEYLSNPDEFDAMRWVGTTKLAATTGPGYLAFGLGRWSCPGRILAVVELKAWILALVKASNFNLKGDKYNVVDPYNITSVPPTGLFWAEPLQH